MEFPTVLIVPFDELWKVGVLGEDFAGLEEVVDTEKRGLCEEICEVGDSGSDERAFDDGCTARCSTRQGNKTRR